MTFPYFYTHYRENGFKNYTKDKERILIKDSYSMTVNLMLSICMCMGNIIEWKETIKYIW